MIRKKIFMPNEIKQKEVVWIHLMGRPITSRHLMFFFPASIIAYFIGTIYFKFVPYPNTKDVPPIVETCKRIMILSSIPVFSLLMSNWQKDGKYLGEKLVTKYKYKSKKGVTFNKKTQRSLNNHI